MKIEQSMPLAGASLVKGARGAPAKKAERGGDEVRLSSLAASLLSASGDEPPFDAGRVAEIKQAISDGKFTIDTSVIADRLIASARELIASPYSS